MTDLTLTERAAKRINEIMAGRTGKEVEQVRQDTDRDFWMTAEEAVGYGLIDTVLGSLKTPVLA